MSFPEHEPDRAGFAQWAGLYVSGVLLVVFVAAHLLAVHYLGDVEQEGYTFDAVNARMRGGVYPVFDLALLVLALFHGLIGLHRFIADLGLCGPGALRLVAAVLAAAGLWGLGYGLAIFRAFVS